MNAKEDAKELVDKFDKHSFKPSLLFNPNYVSEFYNAKQCALISNRDTYETIADFYTEDIDKVVAEKLDYLNDVKDEIEKL